MANSEHRLPFTYLAVLAAAVACYAALGAVLFILPRYVPDRLGGGPAAVSPTLAALLASRLAVGAGEGLMMSAAVLWLLQLAGEARRGRALGHIGLANYGGLALGPLLATALGGAASSSTVLWTAVGLPGLGAAAGCAAWLMSGRATRRAGDRAAADRPVPTSALLRRTVPAGVGLLLVNVGYVSVLSFGPSVGRDHATGVGTLVVPVFAAAVIVSRTLGGGIPDRLGGVRTVVVFAAAEAAGLLLYANAPATAVAAVGLLALAIGQALVVPGLGLLALAGVPPASQGAAAGLFFAWFDAGVGLGGPAVGAAASVAGAGGALNAAAAAVSVAIAIGIVAGRVGGARHASRAGRDMFELRRAL